MIAILLFLDYIILLLCVLVDHFSWIFFLKITFFLLHKTKNIHHLLMMINRLIYWSIDRFLFIGHFIQTKKYINFIRIRMQQQKKKIRFYFYPLGTYFYLSIWSKNTFEFDPKTSPLFCSIFKNEKKNSINFGCWNPPRNEWMMTI